MQYNNINGEMSITFLVTTIINIEEFLKIYVVESSV